MWLEGNWVFLWPTIVAGNHLMNERKLMESVNGIEYMPTYEDKDGDWMLVGDVPWKYVPFITFPVPNLHFRIHHLHRILVSGFFFFCRMFVESCKRIRLMISSEAIVLGPRSSSKCSGST